MTSFKATLHLFIVLILLFLVNVNVFAQKKEAGKCEKSSLLAKIDIKKEKICFMLQGGIAPIYKPGQEVFEKKYKVTYLDLGCVVPTTLCIEHYNAEVAKYLDLKYGKQWRKEVRKDVLGIK